MEEAVKWYRLAADKNHVEAPDILVEIGSDMGDRYWNGEGVKQDLAEAVKWYTIAAEYGEPEIQYLLGDCYRYGKGVEKDLEEAKKWYRYAADQGDDCAKDVLVQLWDED